jgi:ferredoxin-thioredoxin reductase catalytic subunit
MGIEDHLKLIEKVSSKRGWRVNPDREFVRMLAEGLIRNRERYGLATCPCRIATGKKEVDRLIICPCVYAEDDISKYGRCYCGLYMSEEYIKSGMPEIFVPDRHAEHLSKLSG